jgi:tetratricopeptide (TPR) repeat protein
MSREDNQKAEEAPSPFGRREGPANTARTTLLAAGVFLFALLLYLPVLRAGFVNWDDPLYVYQNPHIRSLDLGWVFTAVVASNYHTLTLLSHTLDYALFGLNPWGHHLTSIILHALNSALFFILGLRLLAMVCGEKEEPGHWRRALGALGAALLFAAHPLHVESVAWVSERKDVLSAFFFLLSMLAYLKYAAVRAKALPYALTLILFVLALLSKPMAVTLPAVLLLLDYYPLKRTGRGWSRLVIEKIPFFVLSAASAVLTVWAQRTGGGLRGLETHGLATRIYLAVRAVLFYIYKLILPVDLSPYYPLPFHTSLVSTAFIGSLVLIVVITIICVLLIRLKRWPLTLWLFYLVTLLPVSGLVTVGGQAVADRYAYIPTMGFFLLAGAALCRFSTSHERGGLGKSLLVLPVLVIIVLGVQTIRQERIWHDSISLMSRAIELYPDRAAIPYNNRGLAYDSLGDRDRALADYNVAIAISPEFVDAYINRGIVYGEGSLFGKAVEDFNRALAIDPMSAKAYLNRGAAYLGMGDYGAAINDLERATTLDPANAAAFYNLGLAYMETGQREKALRAMDRAARLGLREARNFIIKNRG